jgi:hypothetical protein
MVRGCADHQVGGAEEIARACRHGKAAGSHLSVIRFGANREPASARMVRFYVRKACQLAIREAQPRIPPAASRLEPPLIF